MIMRAVLLFGHSDTAKLDQYSLMRAKTLLLHPLGGTSFYMGNCWFTAVNAGQRATDNSAKNI